MNDVNKRLKDLEDRVKAIEDQFALSTLSDDELLTEAKKIVTKYDFASASLLQRRLNIGYSRAARIMDQLEAQGIVGPAEGAKSRKVTK